jgi:tetratricopeptide (TPR) repeat protein
MPSRVTAATAAALFLALASPPPGAGASPVEGARAAAAGSDFDEARRILQEFVAGPARGDEEAEALFLLGSITPDAARTFEYDQRIVEDHGSHPKAAEAALRAGQYLYATGRPGQAAVMFDKVAQGRDAGRRGSGSLWLGIALLDLGEIGQAREAFRAAAVDPGLAGAALVGEGDTFRAESRLGEALRCYEAGADVGDTEWRAAAIYKAALAWKEKGGRDEFERAVGRLVREYPASPEAAEALLLAPRAAAPPEAEPGAASEPDSTAACFAIQIGAFGEKANAARVHGEIERRGFPQARIAPEARGDGVLYVVRFGRYASEDEARRAAETLAGAAGFAYEIVGEVAAAPDTARSAGPY